MKSKKLTSTRPKVKLDKEWLQDKENKCSMDEYPFKKRSVDLQKRSIDQQKTSVDLHKYSYETDLRLGHRKSIMNEEISVFLNHSRKKLVTAGRQPL